jgi:hypothetical protein
MINELDRNYWNGRKMNEMAVRKAKFLQTPDVERETVTTYDPVIFDHVVEA